MKTGSFWPICTLALSRLRTRIFGLASRLALPAVPRRVAIRAGLAMLPRNWLLRFRPIRPVTLGTPNCTCSGHCRPSASTRSVAISSTSTSSITSGSGRSIEAMSFSTSFITSGVSRTIIKFKRSSMWMSRTLAMVRTIACTCFTSALVR